MSRNILRYKAIARVATFVDTSEQLSTQTCSECGCVGGPKGLKGLEIREWTCDECGAVHDRDVNAARNILRLGRQTLAEGSSIHTAEVGWRGRHAQYNRIGLSISSAFCSAALGAILGM
jgi:transposase